MGFCSGGGQCGLLPLSSILPASSVLRFQEVALVAQRLRFAMDKVLLFRWLSEVHLRRETHDVSLPNVPALAMVFQFSNEWNWSDACGEEVRALGIASGIHFGDYYRRQTESGILCRGASPENPIVLDEGNAEEYNSESGDSALWFSACASTDGGGISHNSGPKTDASAASQLVHARGEDDMNGTASGPASGA